MKQRFGNLVFLFLIILMQIVYGCHEGGDSSTTPPSKITGHIQKGPFIAGTTIQIQAMDNNLNQTGVTLNGVTSDDLGTYSIQTTLLVGLAEVIANGYYYDEVNNRLSTAPITLRGLSNAIGTAQAVNANVLTTVTRGRIFNLVASGMSFPDAKHQAEGEALSAFGITATNSIGFEQMDISGNSPDDAMLLAVSASVQQIAACMSQDGSSIDANLTLTVSALTSDLQDNGQIDNATSLARIQDAMQMIKISQVTDNLMNRYVTSGETITISNFGSFITKTVALPESFATVTTIQAQAGDSFLTNDTNGNTHLFYFQGSTLMWAKWVSGSLVSEPIGAFIAAPINAAFDTNGNVYITAGNQLITNNTGTWSNIPLAASATINQTSVAVNSAGTVGVAFMDETNVTNTVKYAIFSGGTITTETVCPFSLNLVDSTIFNSISLAFDSFDQPHIAYNDRGTATPGLRHAAKVAGAWSVETVDDTVVVDGGTHIRIQDDDTVYVLYSDRTNQTFKLAKQPTGSAWTSGTLPHTSLTNGPFADFLMLSGGHAVVVSNSNLGTPGLKYLVPFRTCTYSIDLAGDALTSDVRIALDATGKTHVIYRPPSTGGPPYFIYLRSN